MRNCRTFQLECKIQINVNIDNDAITMLWELQISNHSYQLLVMVLVALLGATQRELCCVAWKTLITVHLHWKRHWFCYCTMLSLWRWCSHCVLRLTREWTRIDVGWLLNATPANNLFSSSVFSHTHTREKKKKQLREKWVNEANTVIFLFIQLMQFEITWIC